MNNAEKTKRLKKLIHTLYKILEKESGSVSSCALSLLLIHQALESKMDKKKFLKIIENHWDHINEDIDCS
jgi:hypothetical protein